jgi:signal transduction histidine kinase/CheY-like chemotaxis protein
VTLNSELNESNQAKLKEDELNNIYLLREKSAHITKAARSATLANVLAPLLCIPVFQGEVQPLHIEIWLAYMFVVIAVRTWIVFQLAYKAEEILDPAANLRLITGAVAMVGFGWGLGWVLMAPDLLMVNRMIYVYMITAAMISGMFAYSVNRTTFFAFTLPIMVPAMSSALWSQDLIPWPFTVGLAALFVVVISIAKNFSKTFEDSVRLRFRNERLYQELANERDQSIAANTAKSKFIAVASHDLRQPMHAVNVYLDLVNIDGLPMAERKSLLKIKNSITTLNAMFDALLNISKLDADVMQVNERVFRLDELASTLRDLLETKATNKGLTFNILCPDVMVRGDKLLLQQIMTNLIANAIQYTERGAVEVNFEVDQARLVLEVRDTGSGISTAEQQQIFNQFFRADKTRSLHDGLGLGLSIVKRLCDLIGAEIRVVSEEHVGSHFVVRTPFLASHNEADIHTLRTSSQPMNTLQSLQGRHIAVIEDNPLIVEAYRHTLVNKGAHVHVLSEHEDELDIQLATIDRIDCILCDYRLGQTTGDRLIEKVRENFNEEISAIIVTADTSPVHINLFAQLNVQVLHKPISFQEIAHAIEQKIK